MAYLENAGKRHTSEVSSANRERAAYTIRRLSEHWVSVVIFVAFLGGWEWLVYTGRVSALFFPAPTVILQTLSRWMTNGELTPHLTATLSRVFFGFSIGSVLGLLLGVTMGWSRQMRVIVDPFIAAMHPMPKIAILPLIMIIFGIGETSKVVVVAISVFFQMVINTMAGVRQIAPVHFEVAENYGADTIKVFQRVILPGSLPQILTGVRLALNSSLVITIAIELASAQKGLGALIWLAWETLRTEELYASLIITGVLGIGFNVLLLRFITSRFIPWHREREEV